MIYIVKAGGVSMSEAIGNTFPGNFGVGTDEACRMIGRISSKPTKDVYKDWKNFLLEIIESTVAKEPHLGDNLKQQCLDYLKEIKEREKKEGRL